MSLSINLQKHLQALLIQVISKKILKSFFRIGDNLSRKVFPTIKIMHIVLNVPQVYFKSCKVAINYIGWCLRFLATCWLQKLMVIFNGTKYMIDFFLCLCFQWIKLHEKRDRAIYPQACIRCD